jgi:hypothetical protein
MGGAGAGHAGRGPTVGGAGAVVNVSLEISDALLEGSLRESRGGLGFRADSVGTGPQQTNRQNQEEVAHIRDDELGEKECAERLVGLNRLLALLFGSNANGLLHGTDKYFPVPDFAGFGAFDNGGYGFIDLAVGHYDFDLQLRQKVDSVFAAAINLGVSFLAAEAFDFGNGHALDAEFVESILHLVQLEWFDDGFNFLHVMNPGWSLPQKCGMASTHGFESERTMPWTF